MHPAAQVVQAYLNDVQGTDDSGNATPERSHYPALRTLFDGLGLYLTPRVYAVTDPAGVDGSFPDVTLYERDARVLAVPVEVKPSVVSVSALLQLEQATRYAEEFGGGWVLLTNTYDFVVAQLVDGSIVEVDRVALPRPGSDADVSLDVAAHRLLELLQLATSVRATLTDPKDVARHLAMHARLIQNAIATTVGDELDTVLSPVAELFRTGLGTELDTEFFLPTTVQTLVYGLFASWLQSGEDGADFEWQGAAYDLEVPLFAEVLHACLRPQLIRRCDLFPLLGAAASVLRRVDRPTFESLFDGAALEYFYEPFLAAFDPELRDRLGVWYTPTEIAEHQVARIHHELIHQLEIPDGLADESVLVLDPATGTGTYIAAVLRFLYRYHIDNGEPPTVASERVLAAATTRVVGFEILPAAFLVAHLNISRSLQALGVPLQDTDRLRIYLTNSLQGWDPAGEHPELVLFPELEAELEAARSVKLQETVLACVGNPPYEGLASAASEEERRLVEPWIAPLWPVWRVRKHRLNDHYIRFWRIAVERVARRTGRGVVSFITNRQWLGGRSYPAMRESILDDFDRVVIDDLHGSVHDRSHPGDQSIFTTDVAAGIRVGTAIVTATRLLDHTPGPATTSVFGREFRGSAASKRDALRRYAEADLNDDLMARTPTASSAWRFTSDAGDDYPAIDEYFDYYLSGVQPVRDEAVLSYDRDALTNRMTDYWDASISWPELVERHPGFGVERSGYNGPDTRARLLNGSRFRQERVTRYLHRPFDARWLYWEPEHGLLNRARPDLMPFWKAVDDQIALVLPQTPRRMGAARPLVATQVPGFEAVDPNARVFPLWRPGDELGHDEDQLGHELESNVDGPNVRADWIAAARAVGLEGDDRAIAATLFHAILGVTASRAWLEVQPSAGGDFPSLPLPASSEGLNRAAAMGRRYAELVDPDARVEGVTHGSIRQELRGIGVPDSIATDPILEHGSLGRTGGRREGDDLLWAGESGWRNIPEVTWAVHLGGFPPIAKMLSYRVGTRLTSGRVPRLV